MSLRRDKQDAEQRTDPIPSRVQDVPLFAPKTIAALVAGLLLVAASLQLPDEFWQHLLTSHGIRRDLPGFLALSGVYVLAVVLLAPLSPFALAAGVLFGFWWGTFLAVLALNFGAALAFFIARFLLREHFVARMSRNSKVSVLARAMRGDAVKTIAILRLNPVVPFNLQNYVCGATGVSFGRYALGTFLGAAPFTVALVYLGHAGRRLVQATGLAVEEWTAIVFVAGLVLTLPMTWTLLRKTIKHLRECRDNDKVASDEE